MKYQQVMFKLQEAEAAWELFEQTRRKLAQFTTVLSLGDAGPKGEDLEKVKLGMAETEKLAEAYEQLVLQRTGTPDVEAALEKLQEVAARLNHVQERRTEHLRLKTELEAELALGNVEPEQRLRAESVLDNQKRRMEVLCQQAESSLPADRLILL